MNKPNIRYEFFVSIPGLEYFLESVTKKETTVGDLKLRIIQKIALKILEGTTYKDAHGGKKAVKSLLEKKILFYCSSKAMINDTLTFDKFIKTNKLNPKDFVLFVRNK